MPNAARLTARSHRSARRNGKAQGVGPGARRPASGLSPQALVERGGSMLVFRRISLALVAFCLSLSLLASAAAATALAGPTVTVRVEGESSTLLPATTITLGSAEPFSGCPADSA